jgi:hypothetical protein
VTVGAPVTTSGPTMGIVGTAQPLQDQRKSAAPDVVGNLRADGAWGSAQVMAVAHEVSGGYYGNTLTCSMPNGHPNDTWGWAVGAGVKINLPWAGPGDYVAAQAAYTEGAVRYISNTNGQTSQASFSGADQMAYGLWSDGVYCGGPTAASAAQGGCAGGVTNIQLTTAWGIAGGWEHFWTPSLRTSIHGSYIDVRYNATANALLCASQTYATAGSSNTINYGAAGASGIGACNQNWQVWQVGTRSQWNVTKDFYMGVDLAYYRLQTASAGAVVSYTALTGQAQPTGLRTLTDQDAFAGRVRWHRDLP